MWVTIVLGYEPLNASGDRYFSRMTAYVSWRKPWKHSQIIASGLLVANIAVPLVLARIFLD